MNNIPQHIAIIMDGNRRWAKKRLMLTQLGHSQGVDALERIIDACLDLGIKYLTAYAFSTENWRRSPEEVDYLMKLLLKNINNFEELTRNRDLRLRLVGDINGLNQSLKDGIRNVEEKTKDRTGLTLNLAVNYGGRAEMTYAAKKIAEEVANGNISIDDINEEKIAQHLQTFETPDPELIIRTGGEKRLSGFLLWQSAYSELYFTDVLWPDFDENELKKALKEYEERKRNFGK